MSKKEESLFGLAPVNQWSSGGRGGDLISFGTLQPATKDEQRITDEYRKTTMVMEGYGAKANYAMTQIAEIHKHSVIVFDETSGFFFSVQDGQRTKNHQSYVDEYCLRSVQMLGTHLFGVTEVGVMKIAEEVHRSLYPQPEPPKQRSLRELIFG